VKHHLILNNQEPEPEIQAQTDEQPNLEEELGAEEDVAFGAYCRRMNERYMMYCYDDDDDTVSLHSSSVIEEYLEQIDLERFAGNFD
jgi:hypothetical protein